MYIKRQRPYNVWQRNQVSLDVCLPSGLGRVIFSWVSVCLSFEGSKLVIPFSISSETLRCSVAIFELVDEPLKSKLFNVAKYVLFK